MDELKEKEDQYGVQFVTVQLQGASPPDEVLTAIKDRMVAGQRQEQAQAEAAQRQTLADAELYAAQKEADAQAYAITTTTEAEQAAIETLLDELETRGDLADKFLDYLMTQELKENSKWIIGRDSAPVIELRE